MKEWTMESAKQELMALQRKMAAYEHAMGAIYYDGETTAPKGTAENRAVTLPNRSVRLPLIMVSMTAPLISPFST